MSAPWGAGGDAAVKPLTPEEIERLQRVYAEWAALDRRITAVYERMGVKPRDRLYPAAPTEAWVVDLEADAAGK